MEYTWVISAMDCKIQEGIMTGIVQVVHWEYHAKKIVTDEIESDSKIYNAKINGSTSISEPTSKTFFTGYDALTKEKVTGWLEESLNIKAMQKNLKEQIDLEISPISITLPPPF